MIDTNISAVIDWIDKTYSSDKNSDFVKRTFNMKNGLKCVTVGYEALFDSDVVNLHILAPLMLISADSKNLEDVVENTLISQMSMTRNYTYEDVIVQVNSGSVALFIDGFEYAIIADVKSVPQRSIDSPATENIIRGPQNGFTEAIRTNTAQVRKIVRDSSLVIEDITLGTRGKLACALLYIRDLADTELVDRLRNRLNEIEFDYIFDSGELEQYIEDSTYSIFPQMMSTERPDAVAAALADGKMAVLLDGSPYALVMPITASNLVHTVEDRYLRLPYADLMVFIRLIAIVFSTLLSGIYIAIVNFHQETIPTDLLYSMIESRARVPFSMLTELLILEIAFELIREASFRMPVIMGGTLGIIGGLVIGQAAVDAYIFSPIPVIIVAITGISSYVIPNYYMSYATRIMKFMFIILGGIMGYLGIAAGFVIMGIMMSSQGMLGIPFVAPLNKKQASVYQRLFFVSPVYKRENRNSLFRPKSIPKQPHISRHWLIKERNGSNE